MPIQENNNHSEGEFVVRPLFSRIALIAICSLPAVAGAVNQSGYVGTMHVHSDGAVMFQLFDANGTAKDILNRPACAMDNVWVVKDSHSTRGQYVVSLLQQAATNRVPVHTSGSFTCGTQSRVEATGISYLGTDYLKAGP